MRKLWLVTTAFRCCLVAFILSQLLELSPVETLAAELQVKTAMPALQKGEVDSLRGVINDKRLRRDEPKRVIASIKRLGELKAESATGDLTELLTFRQTLDFETPNAINEVRLITTGDRYPATSALFQIGKPALPALIKVIERRETSSLVAQNAFETVMMIFREDRRQGVYYLEAAAAKAKNPEAARRLRDAVSQAKARIHKP